MILFGSLNGVLPQALAEMSRQLHWQEKQMADFEQDMRRVFRRCDASSGKQITSKGIKHALTANEPASRDAANVLGLAQYRSRGRGA